MLVGTPATSTRSLIATGMPASGPLAAPASAAAACSSARSAVTVTNAFTAGSVASIRASASRVEVCGAHPRRRAVAARPDLVGGRPGRGDDARGAVVGRSASSAPLEARIDRRALSSAIGTAGMEPAARGDMDRVRRLAREDLRRRLLARVALRHHRDEGLRVRMLGVADDLPGRAVLDDPAQVHDGDPVGEMGGRGQVVGDHQDAHPLLAQPVQERQDARPHRDVQHRHRLVGDQQLGVEHQAGGDRDALALPAGQLVRVAVDEELGRRQPGALQRLPHLGLALLLAARDPVDEQRLFDRVADREARVERLVRDPGRSSGSRAGAAAAPAGRAA